MLKRIRRISLEDREGWLGKGKEKVYFCHVIIINEQGIMYPTHPTLVWLGIPIYFTLSRPVLRYIISLFYLRWFHYSSLQYLDSYLVRLKWVSLYWSWLLLILNPKSFFICLHVRFPFWFIFIILILLKYLFALRDVNEFINVWRS